jgi:hypothetical protein
MERSVVDYGFRFRQKTELLICARGKHTVDKEKLERGLLKTFIFEKPSFLYEFVFIFQMNILLVLSFSGIWYYIQG